MPNHRSRPPADLERSVLETAAELLPDRLGAIQGLGPDLGGAPADLAAATAVSDVWSLYHLGLDRIVDGTGLPGTQPIGWRALVRVGNRAVAYADVGQLDGEATEVRQMTYGPVVGGITTLAEAPRAAGTDEDNIEERVLQIPGVYLTAVWEHHPQDTGADVLIPSAPAPEGLEAGHRYPAEELLALLTPLARERMAEDPTRARGTPSGTPPPR